MPSKYSGAGPTFRRLAENIPNIYLAAEESCFNGDINDKCISLSRGDIEGIRNNQPLNPYLLGDNFDIVVYASPSITLSTNKPQLCWAVGQSEEIHPEIKNLLLHNPKWQQPVIQNKETKIYEFVLGINIPEFEDRKREDFVFQCSNNYPQINSHVVAAWCRKNKIKALFAGPAHGEYRKAFLNEIDYKYTFYLGEISEEEKIKILKQARCYTNLVSHPINGPQLGVKQAWSHGIPVISTNMGIMPEVINNGKNGFIISNEKEFLDAYDRSEYVSSKDCYSTAQNWNIDKMVSSFNSVVSEILK